jgi:hypothetical protein
MIGFRLRAFENAMYANFREGRLADDHQTEPTGEGSSILVTHRNEYVAVGTAGACAMDSLDLTWVTVGNVLLSYGCYVSAIGDVSVESNEVTTATHLHRGSALVCQECTVVFDLCPSPFLLALSLALNITNAMGGRVASPSLEGGQVAVLRLHVASSYHVTSAAYSCERSGRITQLRYLFQLSLRTS